MQKLIKQVLGFGIVGVIATIIDWTIYYLCVNFTPIHYLVANVLGFAVSVVFNYWASMKFVFTSKFDQANKHREFIIFMILSLSGLLLNSILLWVSVEWIGWSENFAKIPVSVLVMTFNFVTRKLFIEGKAE